MKIILTVLVTFFGSAVLADETERFVTGFIMDTLFLYDDDANEVSKIKARNIKLDDITVDGKPGKGLKIYDQDTVEGLVQVSLNGDSDQLVWLETMAVEIEPDNQLTCPTATTAKSEVPTRALTVGFGEHCAGVVQSTEEADDLL